MGLYSESLITGILFRCCNTNARGRLSLQEGMYGVLVRYTSMYAYMAYVPP